MIRDIDHCPAHIETEIAQPFSFNGDAPRIKIKQSHARAVRGQHLGIAKADAARSTGDDHAIILNRKKVGRALHVGTFQKTSRIAGPGSVVQITDVMAISESFWKRS